MAPVLDDYRNSDLRILDGGIGNKQGMITHFFCDFVFVVFFILLYAEYLCCTSFARDSIFVGTDAFGRALRMRLAVPLGLSSTWAMAC